MFVVEPAMLQCEVEEAGYPRYSISASPERCATGERVLQHGKSYYRNLKDGPLLARVIFEFLHHYPLAVRTLVVSGC